MERKRYQRMGPEKWAAHIAAQKDSGQRITVYCKHHGLTESAFYNYRKRINASRSAEAFTRIDDSAVRRRLMPPAELNTVNTGLIITTPNGYRVQAETAALGIEAALRLAAC